MLLSAKNETIFLITIVRKENLDIDLIQRIIKLDRRKIEALRINKYFLFFFF